MDLITQGILGAAIGQVGFQKRLGRRAILWGAIAGLIPDLDVVIRSSNDPLLHLVHHRGFTHSIYFSLVVAPLLGALLHSYYNRRHGGQSADLFTWIMLILWGLVTHPLLDMFTVYGTQLLWPFSNYRFSFSAVSVIDPVYTGILLISVLLGIALKNYARLSQWLAILALFITSGYLLYGIEVNQTALEYATRDFKATQSPVYDRINSYTSFVYMKRRRLVVRQGNDVWVGFINLRAPAAIDWKKHTQPEPQIYAPLVNSREGQIFMWFCDNQYAAFAKDHENNTKTITLYDCRFGLSGPTLYGFWGIAVEIDHQGNLISPIRWLRQNLDFSPENIEVIVKHLT